MTMESAPEYLARPIGADMAEFLGAMAFISGNTSGQIADELGVSQRSVSNWMLRRSNPGPALADKIATAFGLTDDEVGNLVPNHKRSRSKGLMSSGQLLAGFHSEEWMKDGKCRSTPPETFFPSDGEGVDLAKRICRDCPVKKPCLEYAINNSIWHGVWGGASERARRRLARRRKAESPLVKLD